jgi:error-prone DNA polymerase
VTSAYAELQVTTNFSFLRGASHPEELAARAAALGLTALAVTDRNTLAGAVRAHVAARETGARAITGARLDFTDAPSLLCLPADRDAYGRLSRLLTLGKRRAAKSECRIARADFLAAAKGQIAIALAPEDDAAFDDGAFLAHLRALKGAFDRDGLYLAASMLYRGDDDARLARLAALARRARIPLVATNDVHMHAAERRPLQDVITCIREKCTIDAAGYRLAANAERHLKPPAEMARLFRDHPDAIARTVEIAGRIDFSLDQLRFEYPEETAPGIDANAKLAELTWAGAHWRYPRGVPEKIRRQIDKELAFIAERDYARYFLTVHDIVHFARTRDEPILCQGRGSAANSTVCYCLRITEVDPNSYDLVFERFLSAARGEPPDIDVDFEHERREEVIQYIYEKYGRHRCGIAATVIHYRSRMALREVGKVFGLSDDMLTALTGTIWGSSMEPFDDDRARALGADPGDPRIGLTLRLAGELTGFPRHLSQHVGGFVITQGPLSEVVPICNAAMEKRTNVEWDKDDLDAVGLLKVDVLALGMLSCIRKAFDLLRLHRGLELTLATVPQEDPRVYEMIQRADTIGVFQVESRAQMSMLPRLKPREFYDLVIEVAIVRPGPIQGGMVHPYLKRREGKEPVEYVKPELEAVLRKTLGVPLFQEQAMRIAIVAAGFTPEEADRLRRSMASFRRNGKVKEFEDKFIGGMVRNGYPRDFAEQCFRQIEGFSEYGFPESHAASFALLVYASAWLKHHHPAVFACALLNSQPMGFYAPAQIVRDARDHGVEVRPVDVNHSDWDCTLEPAGQGFALRLGLRQIKGFAEKDAHRLTAARAAGNARPFADAADLWRRARLDSAAMRRLANADGFGSLDLRRRPALWQVAPLGDPPLPLFEALEEEQEKPIPLPEMSAGEEVAYDYASLRLSLKAHPLSLLRDRLAREGVTPATRLMEMRNGDRVTVCGIALIRQRPGDSGVIFVTLEDETGVSNIVVWPRMFERYRPVVMGARLMRVSGKLQREGIVIHVVAERMEDLTGRLRDLVPRELVTEPRLDYRSRDFH